MGAVERDFTTFIGNKTYANSAFQNENNPEAGGTVGCYDLVLVETLCYGALRYESLFL